MTSKTPTTEAEFTESVSAILGVNPYVEATAKRRAATKANHRKALGLPPTEVLSAIEALPGPEYIEAIGSEEAQAALEETHEIAKKTRRDIKTSKSPTMRRQSVEAPPDGMRRCSGSTRFGIEAHVVPVADFTVQPSRKDGLAAMCKPHWTAYVKGLAADRKANA